MNPSIWYVFLIRMFMLCVYKISKGTSLMSNLTVIFKEFSTTFNSSQNILTFFAMEKEIFYGLELLFTCKRHSDITAAISGLSLLQSFIDFDTLLIISNISLDKLAQQKTRSCNYRSFLLLLSLSFFKKHFNNKLHNTTILRYIKLQYMTLQYITKSYYITFPSFFFNDC